VHHEIAAIPRRRSGNRLRLPIFEVLLCLWQLHDVVGGILEGDELATVAQRYRVIELFLAGPSLLRPECIWSAVTALLQNSRLLNNASKVRERSLVGALHFLRRSASSSSKQPENSMPIISSGALTQCRYWTQ
jgi:hypothetical protein